MLALIICVPFGSTRASEELVVEIIHTKDEIINTPVKIFFTVNNTGSSRMTVNISLTIYSLPEEIPTELSHEENQVLEPFPHRESFFLFTTTLTYDQPGSHLLLARVVTAAGEVHRVISLLTIHEFLAGNIVGYCAFTGRVQKEQQIWMDRRILNNRTSAISYGGFYYNFTINESVWSAGSTWMGLLAGEEKTVGGGFYRYSTDYDDPVKFVVVCKVIFEREIWVWQQILHMYPEVEQSWLTEPVLMSYEMMADPITQSSTEITSSSNIPFTTKRSPGFGGLFFFLGSIGAVVLLRKRLTFVERSK